MNFRLVHAGWSKELDDALATQHSSIRIVCPFIKRRVIELFLKGRKTQQLRVITRFSLRDFSEGVSDVTALKLLVQSGALVRGVRHLHAKVYLFGDIRAIVTSANLTDAALARNHEFGFVACEPVIVEQCGQYFEDLWSRSGQNLEASQVAEWERKISMHLATGAPPVGTTSWNDEGVDAGIPPEPIAEPAWVADADQAFVKFFGQSDTRAHRSLLITEEIASSGSHWACTYPNGKRPQKVCDGAIMFMGRLVKEPDDILIYGRAVGMRHQSGRDDATTRDIQLRPWKARWPHYVRVHHAEFVAGSLANGVSLNELMGALKSDAFESTTRNLGAGHGNTDPRRAYMRQPAVELSPNGFRWMNERLDRAFARYGRLAPSQMAQLDWPAVPVLGAKDGM